MNLLLALGIGFVAAELGIFVTTVSRPINVQHPGGLIPVAA